MFEWTFLLASPVANLMDIIVVVASRVILQSGVVTEIGTVPNPNRAAVISGLIISESAVLDGQDSAVIGPDCATVAFGRVIPDGAVLNGEGTSPNPDRPTIYVCRIVSNGAVIYCYLAIIYPDCATVISIPIPNS